MSRRFPAFVGLFAVLILLTALPPLLGFITVLIPLKQAISSTKHIFMVKVERVEPDKPGMVLAVTEDLKEKTPFAKLVVNLTGDAEGKKYNHTEELLKRVAVDVPVVIFANKRGPRYEALGFTNGTWFQLISTEDKPGEPLRWSFTHCEPYLRKTFKGTTEQLRQIIIDAVAGRREPPAADPQEPPGLGPVLPPAATDRPKQQSRHQPTPQPAPQPTANPAGLPAPPAHCASVAGVGGVAGATGVADVGGVVAGPPLAIIQLPALGILAGLAALFPAVFGGLALAMRRWFAALTLASLLSVLYFTYGFFLGRLQGTIWGNPAALWFSFAGLTFLTAWWSARRYRRAIAAGKGEAMQPTRIERRGLLLLSLFGLVLIEWLLLTGRPLTASPWLELTLLWASLLAATCAVLVVPVPPSAGVSVRTTPETIALVALGVAFVAAGTLTLGQTGQALTSGPAPDSAAVDDAAPQVRIAWEYDLPGGGTIYSTPVVRDGRVYAAAAQISFTGKGGTVFCVQADTGREIWTFNDNFTLKPIFSSPALVGDDLYIGEGFHVDPACRLLCLDAKTGQKKARVDEQGNVHFWEFATQSHVESTPAYADGVLYFGAGDDGVVAVEAASQDLRKPRWQYPPLNPDGSRPHTAHVDANPIVHAGRVYAGSGKSRNNDLLAVLCLDAATGREIWRHRVEYSAYGTPALADGRLYIGIGNGTMTEDRPPNVGVLLCLEAASGQEVWRVSVPGSILGKPAIDGEHVYFGSRDGKVYCVGKATGKIRWAHSLGSPVLANPALAVCTEFGTTRAVYVASQTGKLAALHPQTGTAYWTLDLAKHTGISDVTVISSPTVTVSRDGTSEVRHLYIGTGLANFSIARLYCLREVMAARQAVRGDQ
jgi:outer membrane protein assembly factor BamB